MRNIVGKILRIAHLIYLHATQVYFACFESKVECNICHFRASRLASNSWHLYTVCPKCGSDVRQRQLWAAFQHLEDFSLHKMVEGKSILHFAPEEILGRLLKEHAKSYQTADFLTEGYAYNNIDIKVDISDMSSLADESFDCVIACDVLEHVPDHIGGMREVHRILRTDGHCVFTVPQRDYLKETYEDASITGAAERERAYGQHDHLRIYGDDFSSMLKSCGFRVSIIDEHSFPPGIASRNVLSPPVYSTKENVTNFRKVFIGEKCESDLIVCRLGEAGKAAKASATPGQTLAPHTG